MKYRLLDILKCPECGICPLDFKFFEKGNIPFEKKMGEPRCIYFCAFEREHLKKDCNECYKNEIINGVLFCTHCNKYYPIISGIPRFNPDWEEDFPQFADKYKNDLPKWIFADCMLEKINEFKRLHASTKKSFGFEWIKYRVTDREEDIEDFFSKTGTTPEFLRGKLILDVGCGMGRFLMVSAQSDNEVVGIDLSASVERAYKITKNLPFVHVVQGDIMRPPFREGAFDFLYSIGVLHHTPSTKKAFQSASKLVKKGGKFSIWVYQVWVSPELISIHKRIFARTQEFIFNSLRRITMKLPHRLLHYICYIAVPLGWLQMMIRKNSISKLLFWPLLLIFVRGHKKWYIRLLDTFDWYSPKYQWKHTYAEVFTWFQEENFTGIKKTPSPPIGVTGIKL